MRCYCLSLLLAMAIGSTAQERISVAYDMVASSSLNLVSYDNVWTDAFSSSADAFQKYSRTVSSSIPAVLLDESNNPSSSGTCNRGIVPFGDNDEFFGIADTINNQNPAGPVFATWEFNITDATDLTFRIDAAAMGIFETTGSPDYFRWTAEIDGGIVQELLYGAADSSTGQLYSMADGVTQKSLWSPLAANGTKLSNVFRSFEVPLSGTGNIVSITLEALLAQNNEALAFRNLEISSGEPPSCPASECAGSIVTETQPTTTAGSCSLAAVSLQTHTHTNGDVLIELLGPANPADAADLLISTSHGGSLKPSYIPDRSSSHPTFCPSSGCRTFADGYTKQIALLLQEKFIDNYCKVPYVVVNHLHRSKLDANREEVEAAHGDPIALLAWQAFHDYVADAQILINATFGTTTGSTGLVGTKGLLFDVHGYSGTDFVPVDGSPFIQWGYRLSMDDTLNTDIYCPVDDRSSGSIGSFTHARWLPGQSLECLVRGPGAIASRLPAIGTGQCGLGTPSFDYPSPLEIATSCDTCADMCDPSNPDPCFYFSGGYIINVHERIEWETNSGNYFNAVQAELPRCIRFGGTAVHETFADELSIAMMSFLRDLHGPLV